MPLKKSTMTLKIYTGEPLTVIGEALVRVQYGNQEAHLPLVVVEGRSPSLFGGNWLLAIQLKWNHISQGIEEILNKYNLLFKEALL